MACAPACISTRSISPEPIASIMHAPPVVVHDEAPATAPIPPLRHKSHWNHRVLDGFRLLGPPSLPNTPPLAVRQPQRR